MSRAFQTALAAVARFNDAHPWSHNDAYAALVLHHARRVRAGGGTEALDVGCGTGNLVRRLAGIFPAVTGIEPDVPTAAKARRSTADLANVRILMQPFDESDMNRYDLITFVAVLHHLPLQATLKKARESLRPGGRLVVVGISREAPADRPWSIASLILNPIVGAVVHPRRSSKTPTHMTAPTAIAAESYEEIALTGERILPGARLRRGLFWRYTISWTAPRDTPPRRTNEVESSLHHPSVHDTCRTHSRSNDSPPDLPDSVRTNPTKRWPPQENSPSATLAARRHSGNSSEANEVKLVVAWRYERAELRQEVVVLVARQ